MNPLKNALDKKKKALTISIELGPHDEKQEMADEHEHSNKELGIAPDLNQDDEKSEIVDQLNELNAMDEGSDKALEPTLEEKAAQIAKEDELNKIAQDASGVMDSSDEKSMERKLALGGQPRGLREKAQMHALAQKRGMKA